MSLLKKMKDILFEEEEYTEAIPLVEETRKEEPKIVKVESFKENVMEPKRQVASSNNDQIVELKSEKTFQFPDFDEEEFVSSMISHPVKEEMEVKRVERPERIERVEKEVRPERNRYENHRAESRDTEYRKKFKPSPIISPVYGVLNQDYKAEDIIDKTEEYNNINIDEVRKKAFEVKKEEEDVITDPVVTFFEEKEEPVKEENNYKSIDDLLEEASTEIDVEDDFVIPKNNNIDVIEEELEKLDNESINNKKSMSDELDSDLYELIDSMYENREEVE